ncbi:MAG: protein phosphatase CheZ [candidate division KSB1 bacterium]|nr:protein phosphatase CheZ [candidate division KSB1 bacterium]
MPDDAVRKEPPVTRQHLELLLKRVAEVQALFVLVERITPFVEELVEFVYDVGPMLLNASKALRESSLKMPKASRQLDDVTHATEMATTQVLDRVDDILNNLEGLRGALEEGLKLRRALARARRKAKLLATKADGQPDLRQGLEDLASDLAAAGRQLRRWKHLDRIIENTQECSYEIMSALQVQDITAQQLAAARDLIDRVHGRIEDLLKQLGDEEEAAGAEKQTPRKSYDADARYDFTISAMKQEHVDRLLESLLRNAVPSGTTAVPEKTDI